MSDPDVFYICSGQHWQLPSGSHGLWPLCGHLWPLPLCHHHESLPLCPDGGLLLLTASLPLALTHTSAESAHLLWLQYYSSFSLWPQPPDEIILLPHICQWNCVNDRSICLFGVSFSMHCFFLHTDPHHGSQNSLNFWETQSLLHMWLAPHCGNTLLWKHLLCLSTACVHLHRQRPRGYNCLHSSVLHAQSFYLQPKKQRPESGSEEAGGQEETPDNTLLMYTQGNLPHLNLVSTGPWWTNKLLEVNTFNPYENRHCGQLHPLMKTHYLTLLLLKSRCSSLFLLFCMKIHHIASSRWDTLNQSFSHRYFLDKFLFSRLILKNPSHFSILLKIIT